MENVTTTIKQLLECVGFREVSVKSDPESKRVSIYIDDEVISPQNIPTLINDFNQVIKLMAKKVNEGPVIVDINNYRKERERLIVELAKASAKKAVLTKQDVVLPPMNAYERRLIHTELSMHPEVKTESMGEGHDRYVIVKPIIG